MKYLLSVLNVTWCKLVKSLFIEGRLKQVLLFIYWQVLVVGRVLEYDLLVVNPFAARFVRMVTHWEFPFIKLRFELLGCKRGKGTYYHSLGTHRTIPSGSDAGKARVLTSKCWRPWYIRDKTRLKRDRPRRSDLWSYWHEYIVFKTHLPQGNIKEIALFCLLNVRHIPSTLSNTFFRVFNNLDPAKHRIARHLIKLGLQY